VSFEGGPPAAPKRLSASRLRALLGRNLIASLATVDSMNRPHVVPMWFMRQGKRILIPTNSRTAKIRHLAKNPHAAVMIHDVGPAHAVCGVMVGGSVDILSGPEALRINLRIHLRYASPSELADPTYAQYLRGDDVTIAVAIDQVVTWDISGIVSAPG
jgi:nitroimidazol reductase NimA-like FMN-containing flavoprotein (pyridoxamine 5'-phosphate oxidase superfamily)